MKKAVIYGAGNIGRGFIGQLFSMSGYEIGFVDVNESVIARLNSDHQYNIYITDGDKYKTHTVSSVYGINGRNINAIAEEISTADIMATAVGVNVLKFIAEPIALGIRRRFEIGNCSPLNIIICENMIGADKYLSDLIKSYLNEDEKAYFDAHIGLVEPSIGRMVPATPREIAEVDPLAVCVEPFCQLPVDKDAFKGDIPEITNMVPFSPFAFHIRRKLYMHNMSHALTAYLGALRGYEYVWQANGDEEIKRTASAALGEISLAMSKEFDVSLPSLTEFSDELLTRYENKLLGDTVERVGRDTKRKLSENDRFVGAIRLCQKHGINPENIIKGFAAGLLFCPMGDTASKEVSDYLKSNGVYSTLEKYSNIEKSEEIAALITKEYENLN